MNVGRMQNAVTLSFEKSHLLQVWSAAPMCRKMARSSWADSVAFSRKGKMPVVVIDRAVTLYLRKSLLDTRKIPNFSTHPFWLAFVKKAQMWHLLQYQELGGHFGSVQLHPLVHQYAWHFPIEIKMP